MRRQGRPFGTGRGTLTFALAPFAERNFRFQWPSDLATSLAFEMETLVLGWYVLVSTGSVVWLSVFAALQYIGTLASPMLGVMGDRAGHRAVLAVMRGCYALFAATLLALAASGLLGPIQVLVVGGLCGLVRPSDIGIRNTLIAVSMPAPLLMGAMAIERCSTDLARIAGALAGAGLAAALGLTAVYVFVTLLYLAALALTLCVGEPRRPADGVAVASPWADFAAGLAYVRRVPPLVAILLLAFLVNATAFPLCTGLLAYVVRDVYGANRDFLGVMLAAFATGALVGSLLLSIWGARLAPGRVAMLASLVWFPLLLVLAQTTSAAVGLGLVAAIGFVQSFCMVPLSVVLLRVAEPALRGRVMGLRMLAIYGLPAGLLVAGELIRQLGFVAAASLFAGAGLLGSAALALGWRHHLWPARAVANAGVG